MLASSSPADLSEGLLAGELKPVPPDDEDVTSSAHGSATKQPRRLSGKQRVQRLIEASADSVEKLHPGAGACVKSSAWIIATLLQLLSRVAPLYAIAYSYAHRWYLRAPKDAILMVFGAALCFFGGIYTASIAAIEAFRQMGWDRVQEDIAVICEQVRKVDTAQKHDDLEDKDLDGSADVDRLDPKQYYQRKLKVAMVAVDEPGRLQTAIGALWAAYIAVLATLRFQFAKTTAIALGIAEVLELPISRICGPLLKAGLGAQLAHWTGTLLDLGVKFIAIVFAWYLQVLISAVYSAMRGGRMFADGLCSHAVEHGWSKHLEKLPGVSKPFNPDTTHLDETIAILMGVAGFCFQFFAGFSLPLPLNIIFLPFTIIEWLLRWQITFTGGDAGADSGAAHMAG